MMLGKRVLHISTVFLILMALLVGRIAYWQLVGAGQLMPHGLDPVSEAARRVIQENDPSQLQELPQPLVQRISHRLADVSRGAIYDRKGNLLAQDLPDGQGGEVRIYSQPSLANVIGYTSGLGSGVSGLEWSYNSTLLGLNRPDAQLMQSLHQPVTGSDLNLTIDSDIQRAAEDALQGRAGSVVALDGHTGAILAMSSLPHFDPNQMNDPNYVNSLLQCGDSPQCQAPFLNRATQSLYTPGSTFKTVTLIAALDSGQVTPDTQIDFGPPVQGPNGPYYVYRVDGGEIPDPNHKEQVLSVEMCYAKSANAAFARIAAEMPPATLEDYAARLGFSRPNAFPLEIPYSPAQLANDPKELASNNLLRASTGMGQGELLASPLEMGMVVLPVLNNGRMPLPYLVDSIRYPYGLKVGGPLKGELVQGIMKPGTAQEMHKIMVTAVENGSGYQAAVPGMTVGGKTGTAQLSDGQAPHAWFIGFVEQGRHSVVISVIIENGGEGSQAAAPVFAQVAQAAMTSLEKDDKQPWLRLPEIELPDIHLPNLDLKDLSIPAPEFKLPWQK